MVIVPHKFIFLATPRTGSRAIRDALLKLPGAVESQEHHVHPEDVAYTADKLLEGSSELPLYSVIRDPYEQVRSMFYHVEMRHKLKLDPHYQPSSRELAEWARTYGAEHNTPWWFAPSLYPYKDCSDEIFVYEPNLQLVLDAICDTGGQDWIPAVEPVGLSAGVPSGLINAEVREAVNDRFRADIEFFNSLFEP